MSAVLYTIRYGSPHLTWDCPQCGASVAIEIPRRHSTHWRADWRNLADVAATRRGIEAALPPCKNCAGGEEK